MRNTLIADIEHDIQQSIKTIKVPGTAKFSRRYLNMIMEPHQKVWLREIKQFERSNVDTLLLLASRDHRKTTTVSFCWVLKKIYQNRDVRILILSKTASLAMQSLGAIKDVIENKDGRFSKLQKDFGKIQATPWTDNAITVKGRTRSGMKEPTVAAFGVDGQITGGHYDYIILDDICDIENTRTEMRRKYLVDIFYSTIKYMRDPHTKVIVLGTRKHPYDIYDTLIKDNAVKKHIYRAIIKKPEDKIFFDRFVYLHEDPDDPTIITGVKVLDPREWEVLDPVNWPIEKLLIERYSDSVTFDREKQNDISGMVGKLFKREWLKFYLPEDLPKDLLIFHGADPSAPPEEKVLKQFGVGDKPDTDWFGYFKIGADPTTGLMYALDWDKQYMTFTDQVRYIKAQGEADKPTEICIESDAYQIALSQQLLDSTNLPIRASSSKGIDKISRKFNLIPNIQNGRILFPAIKLNSPSQPDELDVAPSMSEFVDKFLLPFPDVDNDDPIDAFEKAVESALRYINPTEGTVTDWQVAAGHRVFGSDAILSSQNHQDAQEIMDYPLVAPSRTLKNINTDFFNDSGLPDSLPDSFDEMLGSGLPDRVERY